MITQIRSIEVKQNKNLLGTATNFHQNLIYEDSVQIQNIIVEQVEPNNYVDSLIEVGSENEAFSTLKRVEIAHDKCEQLANCALKNNITQTAVRFT